MTFFPPVLAMGAIDWTIVAVFLAVVSAIGLGLAGRNTNVGEYFLAGRSMPGWLVALSVVGASISAGTFIGGPQFAFDGNLTFLMLGFGGVIGGYVTAKIFVPALYNANTVTVYGLLGKRFGAGASCAASVVFLLGQLLTAGARLYIAAIAVSVLLFNNIEQSNLIWSIVILGGFATIYTVAGGIRALLYIDALQITIVLLTGLICIVVIALAIPADTGSIVDALVHAPGGNKLRLLDPGFAFDRPYNLIGALVGFAIFKVAQYGTDHEFAQRVFVSRSVSKACRSLVTAQLISLPIVFAFLLIGLLLHIYYGRPEIMGALAPADVLTDSREVFPQYLVRHFPPGLLGVTAVGLLAAALSGFNSAINAMASSVVNDILVPFADLFGRTAEQLNAVGNSRVVAASIGAVQTLFAVIAVFLHTAGGQSLVDFALGIMSYGYAGLLGVFLCAVFTRRGNTGSAIIALVAGALVVHLLQPHLMRAWTTALFGAPFVIAWTWWVAVGATASFVVCALGRPPAGQQINSTVASV